MKRKDYQKPTMKVVKLHHRTLLFQASVQTYRQVNAEMSGTFEEQDI